MPSAFDHIDLRVPDLRTVQRFYVTLLPALGFTTRVPFEGWLQFENPGSGEFFGITESPLHRPNENRIAFRAGSAADVGRLARIVQAAGALNIEGPMAYAEGYHALFFEDPVGNRFEICHRIRPDAPG